ncbi:MAG: class I SAM-dependent methyltransferase [Thermodesulfovibrionales bacterium]|nr:class I SAM-dependent methyltransferase [Thermodesulfovibrionales bacterium]
MNPLISILIKPNNLLGDFEEKALVRLQKSLVSSYEVFILEKSINTLSSDFCLLMESNILIDEFSVNNLIRVMNEKPEFDLLVPVSNETSFDLQRQFPPFFYQTPTVFKWAVEEIFHQFGNQVIETNDCDDFCLFCKGTLLKEIEGDFEFESMLKSLKKKAVKCGIAKGVYVHRYGNCYESPRSDLLPYIPIQANSILDVGCARGLLGEILKKRQDCIVEGIDIDKNLIEWAKKRLDRAILGDIEKIVGTDELGQYDCIICGDVLEHLYNPYDVLMRLKKHLKKEGLLIATVPNVNNWAVIYEMLNGRWDYVPFSILSGTHIRFFTRDNILEIFKDSGYEIKELHFTRFEIPEQGRRFIENLKSTSEKLREEELSVSEITIVASIK